MEFRVQRSQVCFQLRQIVLRIIVAKIQRLPELRLHPAHQHRAEYRLQLLHRILQRHTGLRPAHINGFPGGFFKYKALTSAAGTAKTNKEIEIEDLAKRYGFFLGSTTNPAENKWVGKLS